MTRVRGSLVCSAGSRVQVVSSGVTASGKVHVAVDDVHTGCRRELLVLPSRIKAVPYAAGVRLSAKPWKMPLLDERWRDWLPKVDHCLVSGGAAREAFTDRAGHVLCATSAEGAAKKAWRLNKKTQQIIIRDAADNTHVFSSHGFSSGGHAGVRGGAPKFKGGKHFRQERQDGAWNKHAWATYELV